VTTVLTDAHLDPVAIRKQALPPARLRAIAGSALACGVAGDVLFDGPPQGLGLALYLLAVTGAIATAVRTTRPLDVLPIESVPPHARLLLGVAALFALLIILRDSSVLVVGNTLAALGAIGLAATVWPGSGLNLFALRLRDLVLAGLMGARDALLGTPLFLHRDGRRLFRGSRASKSGVPVASAVARSLVLAATLIVVFGTLLSAGDPVFRSSVRWLVRWDVPPVGQHLLTIACFAWPVLGLAWTAGGRAAASSTRRPVRSNALMHAVEGLAARTGIALNRLDVLTALGAVNTLFALFLVLQLRVLFGGQAYVTATTGLTMAEYARGGFFALTFTAAMTVGLLLLLDTLMGAHRLADWRVSRRLSRALLAFVGVVLASATARMLLYVSTFGISVDRVVALAVIAWVAMVSVWFAATVLRGRPARFVIGALCAGGVTLLSLNTINIDAIVVRSGLARAAAGRAPDVQYMASDLSADGVPPLVDAILAGRIEPASPAVATAPGPPKASCTAAAVLLERWGSTAARRGAEWNLGAWRARGAVLRNERALRALACRPAPASASVPAPASTAAPASAPASAPANQPCVTSATCAPPR
jgi:hypothetical protein